MYLPLVVFNFTTCGCSHMKAKLLEIFAATLATIDGRMPF